MFKVTSCVLNNRSAYNYDGANRHATLHTNKLQKQTYGFNDTVGTKKSNEKSA
jgi:hypothetical protein